IWIALYQSIIRLLAITPEDLLGLSKSLWSWPVVYTMLPLNNSFLWFSLENPDTPLAVLVGVTMWLQQKMVTPNTTDPQQRSQSQLMLWMMPLMFGFLAMSFPSGLALYWVASNVITIIMQYFITGGWGGLSRSSGEGRAVVKASVGGGGGDLKKRIAQAEQSAGITAMEADIVVSASTPEEEAGSDVSADKLRGVSYPGGAKTIRRQSKRSRGHRSKGR
ncbi:MAG: YidC/Oxa1 family membrane protein insertase, partial [Dehalococcoidia bacterium]|nr:YidC/Oxa1 family membrane protein insertase [Dehalococcoidia bacterium]